MGSWVRGLVGSLIPVLLAANLLGGVVPLSAAGPVAVRAAVERRQVYQGEAFLFQIQVTGTTRVEAPSLKGTAEFSAEFLGGQDTSMRMTMNVNGQVSEQVNESYNLNWRITPKGTGVLTIPALSVRAGGGTHQTQAITVQVVRPQESENFKLRQTLSQSRVYVGEPVTLTVTFYLGQNARNAQFSAPALATGDFYVVDTGQRPDNSGRYLRMLIEGREVTAEQGTGNLDGRQYTTVTFRKILVPKGPGAFTLPAATVACEAPASRAQGGGFFDDFFRMGFGGGYERVAVESNAPRLEVLDVPAQGRPANFSGNVGRFAIEAQAQPTSVKVGDPITLTLELAGPAYLEGVKPPRLNQQADLARDFKIPEEASPGRMEGGKVVFVQTLRAKSPDVKEIPPVELSYFDTKEGAYKVARTSAIPIRVEATRVVTAWDAEGAASAPEAKEIKSFSGGISANYEDTDALTPQAFGAAGLVLVGGPGAALSLLPPLVFLGLLVYTRARRRREADPLSYRARGAGRQLQQELKAARSLPEPEVHAAVLGAFRGYLAAKLKRPVAALTFAEAAAPLREKGVPEESLAAIEKLLAACEAERFAGGASGMEAREALDAADSLARDLGRRLG